MGRCLIYFVLKIMCFFLFCYHCCMILSQEMDHLCIYTGEPLFKIKSRKSLKHAIAQFRASYAHYVVASTKRALKF